MKSLPRVRASAQAQEALLTLFRRGTLMGIHFRLSPINLRSVLRKAAASLAYSRTQTRSGGCVEIFCKHWHIRHELTGRR
jgi:hypothetical protein